MVFRSTRRSTIRHVIKDQNFAHETANFESVVANLNRLHPRFVVICGDLADRTGDPAEMAECKRILKNLDPSIPVYNVAGNTMLEMFRPLKLYDAPNSSVASPTFGQILGGSNNRVLQLGVRISF